MNLNNYMDEKLQNSTDLFSESVGHFSRLTWFTYAKFDVLIGMKRRTSVSSTSISPSAEKEASKRGRLCGLFQGCTSIALITVPTFLVLGINAIRVALGMVIHFVQKYGLFHPTSVTALQQYLLVEIGLLFIISGFISAPKFIRLRAQLDSIILSKEALSRFRKLVIILMVTSSILSVSFVSVHSATVFGELHKLGIEYSPSWLSVVNIISTYHLILVCFLGPLSWILLATTFICMAFEANSKAFDKAISQQDESGLRRAYFDYLRLSEIVELADSIFAFIVMISIASYTFLVGTSLINLTYYLKYIPLAIAFTLMILIGMSGICFAAISVNEKGRSLQASLYKCIPQNLEMKVLTDLLHRKVTDFSWGLTMGRMVYLDRAALLTITGGILAFVALWAQFASDTRGSSGNGCSSSNITIELNMTEFILQM